MSLTPPPPPPLRSDPPADFIAKAEAYLSWQQTFVTEIEDAIQIAGITVWVSGTTYAVGDVVWSPTDYRTYRRIVAGAGTTDPASDAVNWQPLPLGAGTKLPVRVATTANITLSGGAPNTLDGATLAADDRILVKNQSTASENGIYTVATLGTGSNGTWTRAPDADGAGDMFGGMLVAVSEGTANGNSLWMLTTNDPITIGTTALTFVSPGEYVESVVNLGSAISLTSSTEANITSISLPPGDWDVSGTAVFSPGSTTSVSWKRGSISTTSNTFDYSPGRLFGHSGAASVDGVPASAYSSQPLRFHLTSTTTIYLVASSAFTVSTMDAYGIISARRVR